MHGALLRAVIDVIFSSLAIVMGVVFIVTTIYDKLVLEPRKMKLEFDTDMLKFQLKQAQLDRDHYKGLWLIAEEYFSAVKKTYPNVGKTAKPTSKGHPCHDDRCHGKGHEGHFCHNGDCERDLASKKIKVTNVRSNVCPVCEAQPGDACNLDKHNRPVTRVDPRKVKYEA